MTARRCSAQLSWRLPPRSRRWRLVLARRRRGSARRRRCGRAWRRWRSGRRRRSRRSAWRRSARRSRARRAAAARARRRARRARARASLIARVSSRMRRSSSRAIRTRVGLLGARQAAGDAVLPARGGQRARRDLELGPEVVQVPAQVVDQRGALRDQPLAVIDEQPDVELGAGELRDRQRLEPFAQRGARDRDARRSRRTCRARAPTLRAPAISFGATRTTRSPRASRNRSSAPGDVPAVLDRPHPLAAERRAPRRSSASNERRSRRHRALAEHAGRSPRRPPRRVCERLCVSAPITIILHRPFVGMLTNGSPADTSQSGRCHAPIRSRRRSSDGGGRHNIGRSDHTVDRKSMSQPAAGPRTYRPRRTPPPDPRTLSLRKSRAWRTDSSGFERRGRRVAGSLIDARRRSVRCVRVRVHGFAGISGEPGSDRLAGVVVVGLGCRVGAGD